MAGPRGNSELGLGRQPLASSGLANKLGRQAGRNGVNGAQGWPVSRGIIGSQTVTPGRIGQHGNLVSPLSHPGVGLADRGFTLGPVYSVLLFVKSGLLGLTRASDNGFLLAETVENWRNPEVRSAGWCNG